MCHFIKGEETKCMVKRGNHERIDQKRYKNAMIIVDHDLLCKNN